MLVLIGVLGMPLVATAEESAQQQTQQRTRSMARTWGGVGLMVGGLALIRQKCDGIRIDNLCLGSTTWMGGSTVGGLGVIGAGVLLTTVWSDVPVMRNLTVAPTRGGVDFGASFSF
jgi:hypothetical protein